MYSSKEFSAVQSLALNQIISSKFNRIFVISAAVVLLFSCAEEKEEKTVATFTETGTIEIFPNKGSVDLRIVCENIDAKKSKECLLNVDKKLHKKLLEIGIKESEIDAGSISRNRLFAWEKRTRKATGYSTSRSITLNVEGVERLENAVEAVFEYPEVSVHGTMYSHSKEDSLKTEAYLLAIEKLKVRGEQIKKSIGSKECKIANISDNPIESSVVNMLNGESIGSVMAAYDYDSYGNFDMRPNKLSIQANASMAIQCDI